MTLRPYSPTDWERLCIVHDAARVCELDLQRTASGA